MEIIKWLGIPEELYNAAILSLTHRSMRVTDNDIDGDKLKQYHDIGKNVYEALLLRFISRNFSLSINGIHEGMNASKSPQLVYTRLKLNELSVVAKGVDTDKIIEDLVYQFFGFLYEEVRVSVCVWHFHKNRCFILFELHRYHQYNYGWKRTSIRRD